MTVAKGAPLVTDTLAKGLPEILVRVHAAMMRCCAPIVNTLIDDTLIVTCGAPVWHPRQTRSLIGSAFDLIGQLPLNGFQKMNVPVIRPPFLFIIFSMISVQVLAADEITKTVAMDKYYDNNTCTYYLSDLSLSEGRTVINDSKYIVQQDIIFYLSGGDSTIGDLIDDDSFHHFSNVENMVAAKDKLKGRRRLEATFTGSNYNSEKSALAAKRFDVALNRHIKKSDKATAANYVRFLTCNMVEVLNGKSIWSDTYETYEAYVMSHVESATIGYFSVSTGENRIALKVGTGNSFVEPKSDPDSRFFIVDARFKNNDTESRLPFEGSLFINYNGKQYEFDSTEPIMLEGYNIWFRKVNPLITVKTKIVYRIPNEIEGEVFWRPGRNKDDTRLWVGYVKAAK